jgi:hypothetical protein
MRLVLGWRILLLGKRINLMIKLVNQILAVILFSYIHFSVNAADIQYYKVVGLNGLLSERKGIDCCIGGIEREIVFPVIQLNSPVNVISQNPSKPEPDEVAEIGITVMQLVMTDDLWKIFKKLKGRNVRLLCMPFHAFNGHHLTPVLCDVKSIN